MYHWVAKGWVCRDKRCANRFECVINKQWASAVTLTRSVDQYKSLQPAHYYAHYKHLKAADWWHCSPLTLNILVNCFSLTMMASIQRRRGSRRWLANLFPEPLERHKSLSCQFIKSHMQIDKSSANPQANYDERINATELIVEIWSKSFPNFPGQPIALKEVDLNSNATDSKGLSCACVFTIWRLQRRESCWKHQMLKKTFCEIEIKVPKLHEDVWVVCRTLIMCRRASDDLMLPPRCLAKSLNHNILMWTSECVEANKQTSAAWL